MLTSKFGQKLQSSNVKSLEDLKKNCKICVSILDFHGSSKNLIVHVKK